jgi:hypothetical protein
MINVSMDDTQQVTLTAVGKDARGDVVPATFTWTVDNTAALTLVPSADTTECMCVAAAPGDATVTVTAGAAADTAVFTVAAGAVQTVEVTAGTPGPQTPPV